MTQQILVKQGAFDADLENAINANFTDLYITAPAAARVPANITAAGALGAANVNRVSNVNSAAGIALTLPLATGSGNNYQLFIGTTITSIGTTITAAGSDKISGNAYQTGATGASTAFYIAAGTTVTLNGTTKGGIKGDYIIFRDVASALWNVEIMSSITSTAATPFS